MVFRSGLISEDLREFSGGENSNRNYNQKKRRADVARGVPGVEQWLAVTLDYQRSIRYQKK